MSVSEGRPAAEQTSGTAASDRLRTRRERARDRVSQAADWTWRLTLRIHLGTRKPANWVQLFKFGIVGGSGYAVNLLAFALFTQLLAIHYIAGAVLAFCVAVTNNFLWNRHWTFQATEGHAGFQAARFFAISVAGLGVNVAVLYLLVALVGVDELPGQAIAVAVAMPVNFVGNKLWTFNSS